MQMRSSTGCERVVSWAAAVAARATLRARRACHIDGNGKGAWETRAVVVPTSAPTSASACRACDMRDTATRGDHRGGLGPATYATVRPCIGTFKHSGRCFCGLETFQDIRGNRLGMRRV
jgi:hypothetical protein